MNDPAALLSILGLALAVTARAGDTPCYLERSQLLSYRDAQGVEQPVRTRRDWARRRADILASMERVMGPLPGGCDYAVR